MHTGVALYTCPNCPLTFASSANMYRHRQRSHKAEYEAGKQQKMSRNIIKEALSKSQVLSPTGRYSKGKQDAVPYNQLQGSFSAVAETSGNTNITDLMDIQLQ